MEGFFLLYAALSFFFSFACHAGCINLNTLNDLLNCYDPVWHFSLLNLFLQSRNLENGLHLLTFLLVKVPPNWCLKWRLIFCFSLGTYEATLSSAAVRISGWWRGWKTQMLRCRMSSVQVLVTWRASVWATFLFHRASASPRVKRWVHHQRHLWSVTGTPDYVM